jgi:ABC-type branched-subunit amino acid transport system ATPase component
MSDVVLETRDLAKHFDGVVAAQDVSVSVSEGERVGIIGANGAGKTTFVNMVTGYLKPETGRITYRGEDITALQPRDITRLGIRRSFQVPQLFPGLTVLENLLVARTITLSPALAPGAICAPTRTSPPSTTSLAATASSTIATMSSPRWPRGCASCLTSP